MPRIKRISRSTSCSLVHCGLVSVCVWPITVEEVNGASVQKARHRHCFKIQEPELEEILFCISEKKKKGERH